MAGHAGMSRSAFARKFQQLTEITPMHYVAHWRMQRAYDVLASTRQSVASVAEMFGYLSEASFSKAFKQHIGVGPGVVIKRNFAS
jgi:transcriptional regulator GlxA family with amidase domain